MHVRPNYQHTVVGGTIGGHLGPILRPIGDLRERHLELIGGQFQPVLWAKVA